MFQPDFTRRQQIAEQHIKDMQQEAARQQPDPSDPDDPRAAREPARFVLSAPIVLGVIVLILAIISCVGVLHGR